MDTETQTQRPAVRHGGAKRYFRYWYLRIMRIQASPYSIAMGLAVGVFAGLLPVIPVQMTLALALAFLFRGSKLAALLGTWVSNPLNVVPQYMLCYYLGSAVVPFDMPSLEAEGLDMARMLDMGWEFSAAMLSGGLLVALPGACVTYVVAFKLVHAYRLRKRYGGVAAGA